MKRSSEKEKAIQSAVEFYKKENENMVCIVLFVSCLTPRLPILIGVTKYIGIELKMWVKIVTISPLDPTIFGFWKKTKQKIEMLQNN